MFRFFKLRKWFVWSWLGSLIILLSFLVQLKIDVKSNEWFDLSKNIRIKSCAEWNQDSS